MEGEGREYVDRGCKQGCGAGSESMDYHEVDLAFDDMT